MNTLKLVEMRGYDVCVNASAHRNDYSRCMHSTTLSILKSIARLILDAKNCLEEVLFLIINAIELRWSDAQGALCVVHIAAYSKLLQTITSQSNFPYVAPFEH